MGTERGFEDSGMLERTQEERRALILRTRKEEVRNGRGREES